jgi:DNA-binding FadR family transcriptional regulator
MKMDVKLPPWELDSTNQPLVKEKVRAIASELFSRIATGRYPYATRIATERELAEEFDDSRATIRQALEFLESYDVVARHAGSGTFVTYRRRGVGSPLGTASGNLDIRSIAERASPFELGVACSILEPEIVRLATISMSSRDMSNLRELLEQIERVVTDADQFARLEKDFLMTIAEGTHNRLLIGMYKIIDEVRRQPQWCAIKQQTLSPGRILDNKKRLLSLFKALEMRDIESAVAFMKLHIASMQEDMIYSP